MHTQWWSPFEINTVFPNHYHRVIKHYLYHITSPKAQGEPDSLWQSTLPVLLSTCWGAYWSKCHGCKSLAGWSDPTMKQVNVSLGRSRVLAMLTSRCHSPSRRTSTDYLLHAGLSSGVQWRVYVLDGKEGRKWQGRKIMNKNRIKQGWGQPQVTAGIILDLMTQTWHLNKGSMLNGEKQVHEELGEGYSQKKRKVQRL